MLIAGSYGHGNCGDEAILGAIVADLRRRDPDLELTVVAGDVGQVRRDHGVDAVSWTDWAAILDAVKSADLVLQGGGGLFFDYFPFEPAKLLTPAARELTHHASIAYAVRLLGKPFMLYACGVGPLRTEDSRHAVAGICEGADRITVRDEESAALLAAIGIPEKRIEVTADPAFRTPFGRPPDVEGLFGDGEGRRDRPLFVACPRPWPADAAGEGWLPKMAAALGTFVRACDGRLVLVPFHATVDDPVVDRMAAESGLGDDVRTLPSGLPYSQVAGWIRAADMVVGMRLHSIIFAAAAAVPAVAVAYDPKVRSLARALEIEDCAVDLDAIDALEGVLRRTWERRGDVAERLRRSSERLKSATDRNGDLAMALLASRAASAARSGVPASPVPPDEPQRKPSTSPRILFLLALPASDSLLAMLHARLEGLRDRGVAAMVCFLSTSTGESAAPEFELPAQVCGREGLAEVLRRFEPDVIDLIDAGDSLAEIERTRPGARVILEVRTSDPVGLAPLLDPALASRVEALIVPSRAQAETVAAVSAAPVPVLVVPDSLERESRDAPEADVEIPAEPVVGWSGSWDDPGSNWEDFVEIAAGVAGRSPAEFWFVAGAPSSALEQEVISKMVRFAGPEIRFRWFPRRGRRALRSFYATIA
ncbi:MAG TPA: polysaccharide pyruvyl transferase family protein, partial [Thermoanaerobaculia bacterium]|nr:polysaccharide pyruvyl transferase family protein [Thermoanaerobaculia bacterium]